MPRNIKTICRMPSENNIYFEDYFIFVPDGTEIVDSFMKWKSVSILFSGILLMMASMYINGFGQNKGAGDIGISYAKIIIIFWLGYIIIASTITEKIVSTIIEKTTKWGSEYDVAPLPIQVISTRLTTRHLTAIPTTHRLNRILQSLFLYRTSNIVLRKLRARQLYNAVKFI